MPKMKLKIPHQKRKKQKHHAIQTVSLFGLILACKLKSILKLCLFELYRIEVPVTIRTASLMSNLRSSH